MHNDEQVLVMNSPTRQLGLKLLGVQNLVQLEIFGVADSSGIRQQVGPGLVVRGSGGGLGLLLNGIILPTGIKLRKIKM